MKFLAEFFLLLLIIPIISFASTEVSPRHEELAQEHIFKISKQRVIEGTAWLLIDEETKDSVQEIINGEIEEAEKAQAQKALANQVMSQSDALEAQALPESGKKALEKMISILVRVYTAGLEKEKLNQNKIKEKVLAYELHLRGLAANTDVINTFTTYGDISRGLAELFANSYVETIRAVSTGDKSTAKKNAAITLRILTESYLQAGLNSGSSVNRQNIAKAISFTAFMASLATASTTSGPTKYVSMAVLFASLTGLMANVIKSDIYSWTGESHGEAFFPFPKTLLGGIDQRLLSKRMRSAFWSHALFHIGMARFEEGAISTDLREKLKNIKSLMANTRDELRLNEVATHLASITESSVEDLVSLYRKMSVEKAKAYRCLKFY